MPPLYAALTARLMQLNNITSIQNIFKNGSYYTSLSYNDITTGNNGGFNASLGWDPVTGLGSFKNFTLNTFKYSSGSYNSRQNSFSYAACQSSSNKQLVLQMHVYIVFILTKFYFMNL